MRDCEFKVGKQVSVQTQLGKPEWSDAMMVTIPKGHAWRLVREILAQLEHDDGDGVAVTLFGKLETP